MKPQALNRTTRRINASASLQPAHSALKRLNRSHPVATVKFAMKAASAPRVIPNVTVAIASPAQIVSWNVIFVPPVITVRIAWTLEMGNVRYVDY